MAPLANDILREIADETLPALAELYKKHVGWAPHVLSLIHMGIRWKRSAKYRDCISFTSPNDSWERDGTIVVLFTNYCYNIFVFTLDEKCTNLREGLSRTNFIDYKNPQATFFCVHEKHVSTVMTIFEEKELNVDKTEAPYLMYALAAGKSEFSNEHPTGVYLRELDVESAAQIDSVWPYKYRGSQDYIASLIESNGGYGVFLKNGDEMVAWAVKHCLGHIGMVQTRENEKKKGYGLLVTKALAKEIVEEGQRPFATIYAQNKASICMFEKLGFQKIGNCYFINQLT
jgi:hypothetical protein